MLLNRKVIFAALIFNIVLIPTAIIFQLSIFLVFVLEVLAFVGVVLYRAWFSPQHKLGKEAAALGWIIVGTFTDDERYRNTMVQKGIVTAFISFKDCSVFTLEPIKMKFNSFSEVEEYFGSLTDTHR